MRFPFPSLVMLLSQVDDPDLRARWAAQVLNIRALPEVRREG